MTLHSFYEPEPANPFGEPISVCKPASPMTLAQSMVMDNLNTHKPSSLYKAFPAAEAKRIVDRLEFHYTPKHGSWLNIAEIEFGILQRQCLNRRIPEQATLRDEVAAWQKRRNTEALEVNWRFTTEDARIKLKRLYPSIQY